MESSNVSFSRCLAEARVAKKFLPIAMMVSNCYIIHVVKGDSAYMEPGSNQKAIKQKSDPKYKDTLFRTLFREKDRAIELCNAVA